MSFTHVSSRGSQVTQCGDWEAGCCRPPSVGGAEAQEGLLLLAQEQDPCPDLLWGQADRGGASPPGAAADGRKDREGGAGQDSAGGVLASIGDSIPQVTCL